MNGAAIVRALLLQHAPLVAELPAERIMAGVLPQGIVLPAIGITEISSVDRNVPSRGATRHVTDRVQVTVLASSYPAQKDLIRLVRAACADRLGDLAGATAVTVHTDGRGPDFRDADTGICMQSQDFRVGYTEPA